MRQAALLMTGEEILSGDVLDTNSKYLSQQCQALGIRVRAIVTVGDEPRMIEAVLKEMAQVNDLVIVNGGLGPTSDDHTNAVVAHLLGVPLKEHLEAKQHLLARLAERKKPVTAANLKQILLPDLDIAQGRLIPNPNGAAPGVEVFWGKATIMTTPGVPAELYPMWEKCMAPRLKEIFQANASPTFILRTFGIGESDLQTWLHRDHAEELVGVYLGFRAHFPYVDIKLSALNPSATNLKVVEKFAQTLVEELGSYALGQFLSGEKEWEIVPALSELFRDKKLKLALAESITGGSLAAKFTAISGASSFFYGSAVVYTLEAKAQWLGLAPSWVEKVGAVSEEIATGMAEKLFQNTGVDYALGITGFAGPSAPEKELGTVHYCWKTKQGSYHKMLKLWGNRARIQSLAGFAALDGLRRLYYGLDFDCAYSFDQHKVLAAFPNSLNIYPV